jgi:hypothetical protein
MLIPSHTIPSSGSSSRCPVLLYETRQTTFILEVFGWLV